MTNIVPQDDSQNKQNTSQVSVSSTGPEGTSVSIESLTQVLESGEIDSPLENAKEKAEGSKEREVKKEENKKEEQKEQKKQDNKPSDVKAPKIYGYMIPPKIAQNLKKLPTLTKKADPKTGIGALYIFLDRLFRMKNE